MTMLINRIRLANSCLVKVKKEIYIFNSAVRQTASAANTTTASASSSNTGHIGVGGKFQKTKKTKKSARESSDGNSSSSKLKWTPIPLGVGMAYIAYQQYKHIVQREEIKLGIYNPEKYTAKNWQVYLYRLMPTRLFSKAWGQLNGLDLPVCMRKPLLSTYVYAFNCDVTEAAIEDLRHYKNLGEFFRRKLKPSVRPLANSALMISPCDGKVLHFGKLDDKCMLEQVKGVTYSIKDFLGPKNWPLDSSEEVAVSSSRSGTLREHSHVSDTEFCSQIQHHTDTNLYYCIIYLAPGDYHRFHSPITWAVQHRRHFPGELLSVSPSVVRWLKGLFSYNERVVLSGEWEHGFFSLTAVGATNVGSIRVFFDNELMTNLTGRYRSGDFYDLSFRESRNGVELRKGEHLGEFNLGSTIVLVFEAPQWFQFNLRPGDKVKYGQKLGCIDTSNEDDVTVVTINEQPSKYPSTTESATVV